jgi:hypothetical protein
MRRAANLFDQIPEPENPAAKPSSASGRDGEQSTGERPLGEP